MEPDETAGLVLAAAAGDTQAWRTLVTRYGPLVWSVARGYRLNRADAEDVTQTTWERLARSIKDLREPERVGGWLATTARREALRVYEMRRRVMPGGDLAWLGSSWIDDATPDQVVVEREHTARRAADARRAWQALRELSAECQQLLRVLMAVPAPSYVEVAAALGRPVGSIGPTRRRCLDRLRALMIESVSGKGTPAHD